MKSQLIARILRVSLTLVSLCLLAVSFAPVRARSLALHPSALTEASIAPGDPILIAFALWNGLPDVQDVRDAIQLALNDHGLIHGFSLQRNDYDSGCDFTSGQDAANVIVAEADILGVIGPICSSSTTGAAPVLEANLVVMLSPSNTGSNLSVHGPNIFNRVVVEDPFYANWEAMVAQLPSVHLFNDNFEAEYGRTPNIEIAKYAYDATKLLLERIEEVSVVDGGGNLVVNRSALATAVRLTSNFAGVTGNIALEVDGDRVNNFETAVWTDPFSAATLNNRWGWQNEDPTHWSLTTNPGYLRIITQPQPIPTNLLAIDVPQSDFEARVGISFSPTENIQRVGLVIYNSSDNWLALWHAYCDFTAPSPPCPGDGIFFDHIENGSFTGDNFASTSPLAEDMYLRIVRDGNDYSAYVSVNGRVWTHIGTHTLTWTPLQVGVTADNVPAISDVEIPADFDFFIIKYPTLKVYMPLIQ